MKKPSDSEENREDLWERLIGLGEQSVRKSYYPELQKRLGELERFRVLLDSSNDLIFMLEVPSGRIVDMNESVCRQTGCSRRKLLGLTFFDCTDREREGELEGILGTDHPSGRGRKLVCSLKSCKRDPIPVEVTLSRMVFGDGEYVAAIARDITEREQAEAALKESERRLSTLMGNLPGMAYRCGNDRDRTIEFASDGCCSLTGYLPEDLIGNRKISFADIIHPDDREAVLRKIEMALGENGPFQIEYRIRTPDGKVRWVWEQGRGILDQEGELVALEGFLIDISERRKAVETLRQSDRMKTEFVKTVAHEFRTPLTSIQGFSELLLAHDRLAPEDRNDALRFIFQRSQSLAEMVDDMLDIARIESGAPLSLRIAPCPVTEIFRQVEPFLKTRLSPQRLELTLAWETTLLSVDKGKVGQVLENLISNAVKFSDAGSPVRIRGDLVGEGYRISVTDRGIGMTPEQVEKIFDKFYRADATDTAVEGVGLGMSMVKNIVEAHGGDIRVESELGRGTTVSFILPVAREPGGLQDK